MRFLRRFARLGPFLAWLTSSVLTVIDAAVLRTTIVASADAINRATSIAEQAQRGWLLRWPVSAIDQFAILILGGTALGLVIWYDFYYRAALKQGTLGRRFLAITAVQIVLFVICGISLLVLRRAA